MDDILDHPQVRNYLALVRLQVLTPLSLLINLTVVVVCAIVADPTIGDIIRMHPTSISPRPVIIAVYVLAIYAGQLGYCLLLVLARKEETKNSLTQGVGLSLVFANWTMALWAISWVFQWFLASTILQGVILLLLLYSNIVLLIYHPPTSDRPFDTMLIHAPLRFFLVLQLSLMFPLSLFVTLGLEYTHETPGLLQESAQMAWPGFGVLVGTNLLGLLVVVLRRDIVWAVAGTWIVVSIWSQRPKPGSVYVTAIIFTVLYPLCLITSILYTWFYQREGQVNLPDDDHPALYNGGTRPQRQAPASRTDGAREIDEDAVWG